MNAVVAQGCGYARRLVEAEAQRSGQPIKAASRTIARRLRTSHGSIWSLLFRPPKDIGASLLRSLETALETELQKEIEALHVELAALRKNARRPDPRTLAEVEEGITSLRAALRGEPRQ
ncbi:MAG: hypothetical protein ACJ8FU_08395 [Xanthobacteraceae bacterium]